MGIVCLGRSGMQLPRWIFYFMDKQEIKSRLIAARELTTMNSGSRNWKDAFKAYEKATGMRLDTGCQKCFQRVLDWLNES